MKIESIVDEILRHGPNRVVISARGEATTPGRAQQLHIDSDVIFIRKDGWSLGAPQALAAVAEALWADEWFWILRRNAQRAWDHEAKPYVKGGGR